MHSHDKKYDPLERMLGPNPDAKCKDRNNLYRVSFSHEGMTGKLSMTIPANDTREARDKAWKQFHESGWDFWTQTNKKVKDKSKVRITKCELIYRKGTYRKKS